MIISFISDRHNTPCTQRTLHRMSVQGSLRGQCWSQLSQPPDTDPLTGAAQPASVRISPVPAPSDDVMKLPREDMTTFGRCPAWDNFVLVTCDKCDKIVKIEAFESHMTLRHGSKSERSAYHRVLAARAAASLQSCEVKLTPCSTATHSSSSSVGDRRSPAALHPLAEAELPSSSCTSPQPSPSPPPDSEPMDTSDPAESLPHKFVSEETDSTTNNVISIPDTDDMANIEIISKGQLLLDSMEFPERKCRKVAMEQRRQRQIRDQQSLSNLPLFPDAWTEENNRALKTSRKRAFGEDLGWSGGGGAAVPPLLELQGVPHPPQRRQLLQLPHPHRQVEIPLDIHHKMQDPRREDTQQLPEILYLYE